MKNPETWPDWSAYCLCDTCRVLFYHQHITAGLVAFVRFAVGGPQQPKGKGE